MYPMYPLPRVGSFRVGQCINCTDKPKFGGMGIRKQSCTYRRCLRPKGVDVMAKEQADPNLSLIHI